MTFLKQSTAVTLKIGPFLDDVDGKTVESGLAGSMTVYLSKNGGALAARNSATAITYDRDGWYAIPLSTTDTNTLGSLTVEVHSSGALPVWAAYDVLPAVPYNALVAGSDTLEVDMVAVDGVTTAADNLSDAFDGTGYTAALTITAATSVTNAVTANVTQLGGSAAALNAFVLLITGAWVTGAAVTGTLSTTQMTTNLTEATNDHYIGRTLFFTSGALLGQGGKLVTDYDGATKRLTFEALTEAPTNGMTFMLL